MAACKQQVITCNNYQGGDYSPSTPQAWAAFIAVAPPGTATALASARETLTRAAGAERQKHWPARALGPKNGKKEGISFLQGPRSSRMRGSGMVLGPWCLRWPRQRRLSHLWAEAGVGQEPAGKGSFSFPQSPTWGGKKKKKVPTSPLQTKKNKTPPEERCCRVGGSAGRVKHYNVPPEPGKTAAVALPTLNARPSPFSSLPCPACFRH